MLPPRRLFYRAFDRNTRDAMNGTVMNVAFNIDADQFYAASKCDPQQPVYIVVKSQNCIVDWGIPLSDESDVDPNNNAVQAAALASGIYTNATAGFQRIRYVRTGLAGSSECFVCEARDVHRLIAYITYVDVRGWDPEIGSIIAASPPVQRCSIAVYDRYPVDVNWVRSFSFFGFYRPVIAANSQVIIGAPPGFARYVSCQMPRTNLDSLQLAIEWQIRETATNTVIASYLATSWAGPIPPWCHLTMQTPAALAADTGAIITWSVRPLIWYHQPVLVQSGNLALEVTGLVSIETMPEVTVTGGVEITGPSPLPVHETP